MGWNSWNAFFNQISAQRIAEVADAFVARGLDKVGYQYLVIDDGCYASGSVPTPSTSTTYGTSFAAYSYGGRTGFRALGDYVHSKGLKFGMYNDSGGSTCAGQPGAYPSSGGREDAFAASYVSFGIDLLKYDYCGNPLNSAYNITGCDVQSMRITNTAGNPSYSNTVSWASSAPSGVTYVGGAARNSGGYLAGLGVSSTTTFYTTNTLSGAALITITGVPQYGEYTLGITRRNGGGTNNSGGRYLMVDVNGKRAYEGLTSNVTAFPTSPNTNITVTLKAGRNIISLYNTKSQDCGLYCFTSIRDAFQKAPTVVADHPGQNVALKTCEWANCASWQWAGMIGETNRLYADIFGQWNPMGTWGYVANEYNRAIYLTTNGYAPLGGVWPDGDMLVVALGQYTSSRDPNVRWSIGQNRQHFNSYCIINSPLLLGFDLRNDALWNNLRVNDENYIINNKNIIWLSQDPYGFAGRRIKVTSGTANTLITGARGDYIAKPLSNGDVAVQFSNWNTSGSVTPSLSVNEVIAGVGDFIIDKDAFTASAASPIYALNLDTGATFTITSNTANIFPAAVPYYDAATFRLSKRPFAEGFNANTFMGVGISFDQIDFVGGEIQVGTSNGAPSGTPIMYRNRACGLATVSNNTGATINAAIRLELFNAKGALVWSKTGPSKAIANGGLVPWEYKEELPDIVVGYSMTATLINTDTGAPFDPVICPSYTRYAAAPELDSIELSYAGFARTLKTANENPGTATATVTSKDAELVGTNPVTATATVYNDTNAVKKARILTALYNADGTLADYKLSSIVSVIPEDNVTISDTYFLPADVAGKYVRSFLLDADTLEELAPDTALPGDKAGSDPTAVGITSELYNYIGGDKVFLGGVANGIAILKNNTKDPINGFVLLARYNANGVLMNFSQGIPVKAAPGCFALIDAQADYLEGAAGQTVKAFLWSADTYIPLTRDSSQRIFNPPPANKAILAGFISTASALTLSNYSLATGAALTTALNAAIVVNNDIDAIQATVDAAAAALDAAINGLLPSPRGILLTRLGVAKATNTSNSSRLTADNLEDAIIKAQALYDNAAATEPQIEAEIAALNAAITGLAAAPGGHRKIGSAPFDAPNDPFIPATYYGGGAPYSGTAIQYLRLFDGNTTTYMDCATATEGYGGVDLQGSVVALSKIRFYPRQDTYATRINTCTIRGSNTISTGGTGGTQLIALTNVVPSSNNLGRWYEVECTNTAEFQYIWFQSGSSSFGNCAEMEFYTYISAIDKTLLDAKIAQAATLNAADYTNWPTVATALSAAQSVSASTSATQADIDTAAIALKTAIAGLIHI